MKVIFLDIDGVLNDLAKDIESLTGFDFNILSHRDVR